MKNGSKTAYLFPIWSEGRKNFQKGHYIYLCRPYMVRKKKKVKNFSILVRKDTLQESVVCKEEKLSLICIQKHCSYRVLVQERRNLLYFLILYSNRP